MSAYAALKHEWFMETPKPVEPSMFPTWPAKSEMAKKRITGETGGSPKAPPGGMGYNKLLVSTSLLVAFLTVGCCIFLSCHP